METESDEFLKKYIRRTAQNPVIMREGERIFLPYSDKNPKFILRLFRLFLEIFYPKFELDEENEPLKYLVNIVAGTASKNGLAVRGTVGSGKTLLILLWLKFRQTILNNTKPHPYFHNDLLELNYCMLTPAKLVEKFKKVEYDAFNQSSADILFLDDVGELADVNNFGTRINLLAELIQNRYNKFKYNTRLELYATTNLTSKQLAAVIGERAFSRLMEMVEWNAGLLVGNDRRLSGNILNQWPQIKWKNDNKL